MGLLKAGWPCKEPGCGKPTANNARYCDEHTLFQAVFGPDEAVPGVRPCPFCGSAPGLRTLDQREFRLVCGRCDAHGPLVGEEEFAARAFGFRTAEPREWLSAEKRGIKPIHVKGEAAPGAKPCPFCGGSDLFFDRVTKPGATIAANSVGCRTCDTAGPAVKGGTDEAVEIWNRRTV